MKWTFVFVTLAAMICFTPAAYAAPPACPLAVTQAQFDELRQIESQPQHAMMLEVRATYTTDREKQLEDNLIANDITTAATQFGWPSALAAILICGAPL